MAMKQRYSFDADDVIRQVREAAVKGLEIALASTSDPEVQAQFRAQYSLLPAQENFIRVYIGMREAGRSEKATAQLGGYLAGSILTVLLLNAADPPEVSEAFFGTIRTILSRQHSIAASDLEFVGTPAGVA